MSHEVGEWMNDPLRQQSNVPAFGNIGQVHGGQANLEVGDALSGTIVPPVPLNSMNYDLQELVFFSWFYGTPSIAVDSYIFQQQHIHQRRRPSRHAAASRSLFASTDEKSNESQGGVNV